MKYRDLFALAALLSSTTIWVYDQLGAPEPSFIISPGHSESMDDVRPNGSSIVFFRLYPLLVDSIKRAISLSLKGRGDTLTGIFGHLLDRQDYGPSFNETAMLSHFVHPTMPPSLDANSISKLPLLCELTIELVDSTNQYVFPRLPSLRKLTLIRHVAQPHLILPIIPKIFDSYSLWDSAVNIPSAVFPKLEELTVVAPNVNLLSLHHFLIAQAQTLTSLTLETTTDIFKPYNLPPLLHAATFPVPFRATESLIPVPSYADTRSSTSTSYVIHLQKLRSLSISNLTPLLSPHIEVWACPALEELRIAIPPKLPPPPSFLTTSYISLRKLVYCFPNCAFTREDWKDGSLAGSDSYEVNQQNSISNLLISLLKALPTLEHLVVEDWVHRHVWGEVDWIESLMPPGAAARQDYGIEYDLDCIEDDPWNPSRKKQTVDSPKGRRSRWQTKDGRPMSIKKAVISADGMFLDENGDRLELVESDDEDFDEGDLITGAKQESALHLKIPATKFREPEELLCPRLSQLELQRCFGIERSTMFACLKERTKLADGPGSGKLQTGKDGENLSPLSSPGSSRAPSSGATETPVTEQLVETALSAETLLDREDHVPLKTTTTCPRLQVDVWSCALTNDELVDLYAQYMRGDYVLRKPRRPREPTPPPLDGWSYWS